MMKIPIITWTFQLTTSRRGRLFSLFVKWPSAIVSTHDLTKRSTFCTSSRLKLSMFQLTTSRRGRLLISHSRVYLLLSQLTTSRRGRHRFFKNVLLFFSFNSRPHEEVDYHGFFICLNNRNVSTHDLTKRSTYHQKITFVVLFVSTHDLTKRSTRFSCASLNKGLVSTHDLTKRSTAGHAVVALKVMFQLTTSRRGRQGIPFLLFLKCNGFNSRPHEEVDSNFYAKSFPFKITFCAHCI